MSPYIQSSPFDRKQNFAEGMPQGPVLHSIDNKQNIIYSTWAESF